MMFSIDDLKENKLNQTYFLGKLIVAIGMGALSWAFFTNRLEPLSLVAPTLNYYWMLVIVSC